MLQQVKLPYKLITIGISIIIITFLVIFLWLATLDISKLEDTLPDPTFIYDRNGKVASQLSSSNMTPMPLEEIPTNLQNAMIAIEDQRFYEHSGIDPLGILRALFQDIKNGDLAEGGSTITQQLAKNMFLSSEKTFTRKIKEAGIAIKIDSTLSKEEIHYMKSFGESDFKSSEVDIPSPFLYCS